MRKYGLGIAGMLLFALVATIGVMVSVRFSQRKASFDDAASAVKAVVQIQTLALDDGYFCWTQLQDLVKTGQLSQANALLKEIKTLYPIIKDATIVQDNPPTDYELSGKGGTLVMRFSVKDDLGNNPLSGWVGVARLDFQALLDSIRTTDRLVIDPVNGNEIAYGIQVRFMNPLLSVFDYIIIILVTLVCSFPFVFMFWKRSVYFYETKGIESIIFLFEQTERVSASHSKKVAVLSLFLAKHLGFKGKKLKDIYTAALLHDIGKISIPSDILQKAGALTEAEIKAIKSHPVMSAKILGNFRELEHLSPIVLHHHERMDGSGYPEKLAGEAIPYGSRVIAVVDVFEALVGDRPYRDPISSKEAFAALRRMPLDQAIVSVLIEHFGEFESFKMPNWANT
jgi:putative nucleotidyltransferase with HDIG domain